MIRPQKLTSAAMRFDHAFHSDGECRSEFDNIQTGINMSLTSESDIVGLEFRYPDGRAWSGGADIGYVRAPRVIGQSR